MWRGGRRAPERKREIERQTSRWKKSIHTDRQIYGEIERGKQADKKKDRQTDKERRLHVYESDMRMYERGGEIEKAARDSGEK